MFDGSSTTRLLQSSPGLRVATLFALGRSASGWIAGSFRGFEALTGDRVVALVRLIPLSCFTGFATTSDEGTSSAFALLLVLGPDSVPSSPLMVAVSSTLSEAVAATFKVEETSSAFTAPRPLTFGLSGVGLMGSRPGCSLLTPADQIRPAT